jgi:hypothetical protein
MVNERLIWVAARPGKAGTPEGMTTDARLEKLSR